MMSGFVREINLCKYGGLKSPGNGALLIEADGLLNQLEVLVAKIIQSRHLATEISDEKLTLQARSLCFFLIQAICIVLGVLIFIQNCGIGCGVCKFLVRVLTGVI